MDNGPLKEKPDDVRKLVDSLMAIFDTSAPQEHEDKLMLAFESIWLRICQVRIVLSSTSAWSVAIETNQRSGLFPGRPKTVRKLHARLLRGHLPTGCDTKGPRPRTTRARFHSSNAATVGRNDAIICAGRVSHIVRCRNIPRCLLINDRRYAHSLQIPDYVFECDSIKEIERVGTDLVLW